MHYFSRLLATLGLLLLAFLFTGNTPAVAGSEGLSLGPELPTYSADPEPSLDLLDSVTLEAWVKAAPMSDSGGRIIDKSLPNSQVGYMLDTYPGNSLRMITQFGQARFDAHLGTDHWTYVAGVYSASKRIFQLYVDGKPVQTTYVTGGPTTTNPTGLAFPQIVPSISPLTIGADSDGSNRFKGNILRATIIGRALTADEVAARYAAGPVESKPVDSLLATWYFGSDLGRVLKPESGSLELRRSGGETFVGISTAPAEPLTLWYRKPAAQWIDALPVGNGKIGGMVFGGVYSERIGLNDSTLWSGAPYDGNPSHDPALLQQVRQAVFDGRYSDADKLVAAFQGPWTQTFEPLGDFNLDFDLPDAPIENYRRSLDLTTGIASTTFAQNGIEYRRDVFVSHPDHIMVVRLTSSTSGSVNVRAFFKSVEIHQTVRVGDNTIALTGQAPSNVEPHYSNRLPNPVQFEKDGKAQGMTFRADAKAVINGGTVTSDQNGLTITGANSVTFLIATATSFNGFDHSPTTDGKDPQTACSAVLSSASNKSYSELLDAHLADFRSIMQRVRLNVGAATTADLPTDQRLQNFRQTDDPQFAALTFQFGRYLLLSASREGGEPANLQGIWNESIRPPWSSNYTININTEMNYWPAETCNISESYAPVPAWMAGLAVNGARTASEDYGMPGWCAHHNSDIWAVTWPVGSGNGWPGYANWPMGGVWLCQGLWEHYAFSDDKEYLRDRAYPILHGAAQFCLAWLTPDGHGHLVTSPSTSPEHSFYSADGGNHAVSMATTMDMTLIRDLFTHCIAASQILGIDQDFAKKLSAAIPQLYPYQINSSGRLQEWFEDFQPGEVHHRHLSFLVGLYPGDEIDQDKTPDVYAAAQKALDYRGDSGTGWSLAWKISLWARLHDGDRSYLFIRNLLSPQGTDFNGGAGLCPNLFDSCPPFQIDGNFGYTAGIAEMLLQSNNSRIEFLPALPSKWPDGSVIGLRARGNFTIAETWQGRHLQTARILSVSGNACTVRSSTAIDVFELRGGSRVQLHPSVTSGGDYHFQTTAGTSYEVRSI